MHVVYIYFSANFEFKLGGDDPITSDSTNTGAN